VGCSRIKPSFRDGIPVMWGGRRDRDKRASLPCPFLYDAQHRRARRIFTLIQLLTRPLRYGRSRRFETMPSRPILLACLKMIAPSPSICSERRTPVRPVSSPFQFCFAPLKQLTAKIVPVQFKQVKGVQELG
jgi:hypothetical protein